MTSPVATQAKIMWTAQSKVSRKKQRGVGLGREGEVCHRYLIDNVQEQKKIQNLPEFYLGFIVWGRSPEWPKARGFLGGSPGNFLKWKCAEMRSGAFWDIILRNVIVVCTDLVTSGWFFRYNYSYTVIITIFFGGEAGHFWGEASNTLDRTLPTVGLQADKVGEMRLQLKINYTGVPSSLPLISLLPLFFLCSPFCAIRHCLNAWSRLHIYSVVQC